MALQSSARAVSDWPTVLTDDRLGRRARVAQVAIDHTRGGIYLPRWSPEAERFEGRFAAIRADVTLLDRMDAWRQLFRRYGAHANG